MPAPIIRRRGRDPGGLPALDALRAQRAGVDGLEVEEEGLDHVLGLLDDHEVGEVAALDARGGVEVDCAPSTAALMIARGAG